MYPGNKAKKPYTQCISHPPVPRAVFLKDCFALTLCLQFPVANFPTDLINLQEFFCTFFCDRAWRVVCSSDRHTNILKTLPEFLVPLIGIDLVVLVRKKIIEPSSKITLVSLESFSTPLHSSLLLL